MEAEDVLRQIKDLLDGYFSQGPQSPELSAELLGTIIKFSAKCQGPFRLILTGED